MFSLTLEVQHWSSPWESWSGLCDWCEVSSSRRVSKPKKQPFWSPSKNGLSDNRWRKYRNIYIIYIYIYRKMMRNDGKMMGSHVCPILHRFTYINMMSWLYRLAFLGWWKLAPMEGSWQFGLKMIMVGYRSISMARHRLVTWRPPMLGLQWIQLSSRNQHIQQLSSSRS